MFLKKAKSNDYAAVIPKWIKSIKYNKKIIIFGDGKTSRDFCPIANVVQANILAGIKKLKKKNYVFNVGTGSRISLNQLYKTIYKIFDKNSLKHKIIYQNFRQGDVRHSLSNINKIKRILGYKRYVSFYDGMKETINWFKLN